MRSKNQNFSSSTKNFKNFHVVINVYIFFSLQKIRSFGIKSSSKNSTGESGWSQLKFTQCKIVLKNMYKRMNFTFSTLVNTMWSLHLPTTLYMKTNSYQKTFGEILGSWTLNRNISKSKNLCVSKMQRADGSILTIGKCWEIAFEWFIFFTVHKF